MDSQESIKTIISKVDETIINVCDGINKCISENEGVVYGDADSHMSALTELISARANLENIVPSPIRMRAEELDDGRIAIHGQ